MSTFLIGRDREALAEPNLIATLRRLVFLCVLTNVGTPDGILRQLKEQINQEQVVELRHFVELINSQDGDWVVYTKMELLSTLFSPQWIKCNIEDSNRCNDIQFLVREIDEGSAAKVYLRSLLLHCTGSALDHGKQGFLLPTKCFDSLITLFDCSRLNQIKRSCHGVTQRAASASATA